MIFLTLFAVGAIAAWLTARLRGVRAQQDLALGAGGAFLLGGLAVGLIVPSPGTFDPLVLAIGACGGTAAALLGELLERGPSGRAGDPPAATAERVRRRSERQKSDSQDDRVTRRPRHHPRRDPRPDVRAVRR